MSRVPLTSDAEHAARFSQPQRTHEWCALHLTPEERATLLPASATADTYHVPTVLLDAVQAREAEVPWRLQDRTPEELLEQFRAGQFVDVMGDPGMVALRQVEAVGSIDLHADQHHVYVFTVRAHMLRIPAFPTADAAEAFIEQARAAYGGNTLRLN